MPSMTKAATPRNAGLVLTNCAARKESWADLEDDSRDGAPIFDDSYSEAPMSGLENSKDGLNKQLKSATDLAKGGPTDFGFLVEKVKTDKDGGWQFNATAQEFIPTLSFKCPLVGICHVLNKDAEEDGLKKKCDSMDASTTAGNTPATSFVSISPSIGARSRGNSLEPWDLEGRPRTMSVPTFAAAAFDENGMPIKPRSMSTLPATSPVFAAAPSPQLPGFCANKSSKVGPKKRCKPSTIQVPPPKRIKSEERRELLMPKAASEEAEDEEQHCGASVAGSLATADGVVPDASEGEWQRRQETREKAVQIGKDTDEYRWFIACRPNKEGRDASEPMTPDPRDRTVSKRKWGQSMNAWRQELKAHAEGDPAVAQRM